MIAVDPADDRVDCPACDGDGELYRASVRAWRDCPTCDGRGWVREDEADEYDREQADGEGES